MILHVNRRWLMAGLVAGGALGFGAPAWAQTEELLERVESPYNTIFVLRQGQYLSLVFGANRRLFTESKYNPADPRELPVTYTRFMTTALAYPPQVGSVLQIGLGGGRTSWYTHLHMPAVRIEVAELDPEVIRLARSYFGIREAPNFVVAARDGRMYLRESRSRYDLIFIDAYRGTFVPAHLLTREFFALAKSRLNPGGAVAQNIEPTTMVFDAAVATLRNVFAHVDLYEADGNVVAVAYDGPPKTSAELARRAHLLQRRHQFRYALPALLSLRRQPSAALTQPVMRDDFAPVETLRAIEGHNGRR